MVAADLGQASAPVSAPEGGTYTLVSYMTLPAVVGTCLDYVLFAEGGSVADQYQWTVTDMAIGTILASRTTEDGVFDLTAAATGDAAIKVTGAVVATVSLSQPISTRDATVEADAVAAETGGAGLDFEPVQEMVNDLMSYLTIAVAAIVASAPSTDALAGRDRRPVIAFDCGTDDELLEHNRRFHEHLQELNVEHRYAEFPGGHECGYWLQTLPLVSWAASEIDSMAASVWSA